MQIKSNIAKAVEEVDCKARYDAEVKRILSDPQILAWILKYTVKEFENYAIPEIIACFEGKTEVAEHPVHPGHYAVPVELMSTEELELTAQRVTYDIRFKVKVPKAGSVGMIINVEAQNKFYEKYDLITRGIFYCARMLSVQVKNEDSAEEYKHLQKVYSIWICLQVPQNSEYTITSYRMQREDIYGVMKSTVNQRFDLMELVMICLGCQLDTKKGTPLHQLLSTVLSDTLTPEEKIETMRKDYDIITTMELEGGLAKMCNLSDYIEEKGVRIGIEQGIEQGLKALVNSLKDFIQEEENLYQAVIKNETYSQLSREAVLKHLHSEKNDN